MNTQTRRIIMSRASGHTVMGRKLGVLCADYLELLELRCPNIMTGAAPNPVELVDCVAILSQDPQKAADAIEDGCLWKVFGKCGLARLLARKRIMRVLKGEDEYLREANKLAAWLADNWKPPHIRWKAAGSNQAAAPYTDHIRVTLCERGLCKDAAEAGRYPLSDALWQAEAVYEQETGESRLETEGDRRADAVIDESIRLYEEERRNEHG